MSLDETYARILNNLSHEYEHHTRRLLQFLTFSDRPLTIDEAVDAIAVDIAISPRFNLKHRMPVPMEIASYCSSLVVLTVNDQGNGGGKLELQLAHLSVKDYLLSNRLQQNCAKHFEEATARASIAQVCLAYLLELDEILPIEKLRQSYWLAQYSAQYWMDHAAVGESGSKNVCALTAEFFYSERARINCYGLYNPDRPWSRAGIQDQYDIAPALYYASLGGLYFSVQMLLDKNADVNAQGGRCGNALQAASSRGHDKIVQLLLDKNADINAQGGLYGNALYAASTQGHNKIVQMLLDNNADVNAQGGRYGKALQAASYAGHDKIVQILLDKNADVNAQGKFCSALQAASYRGHDKIVQLLLDKNADVNAQGGLYGNALQAASSKGHHMIVQMLLDKSSNATSGDELGTKLN